MTPRIASLLPGATEMAAALGLAPSLVGVSHECDWPPEVRDLPRLTGSILPAHQAPARIDEAVRQAVLAGKALYQVDGERLRELRPDLVLTQGVCEVCAVSASSPELCALPSVLPGVQVLTMDGATFLGVLGDLERLAALAGVPERGREQADALRRRWQALPGPSADPPSVLMLEWPDPPFFGGHWVPEMVARAGGRDVMGRPGQPSGRTGWSDIAAADPDVIVLIACGFDLEGNLRHGRELLRHPVGSTLRAVRQGRVWACDANAYFSRPGPRLVRGAEILAALLQDPEADEALGARRVRA